MLRALETPLNEIRNSVAGELTVRDQRPITGEKSAVASVQAMQVGQVAVVDGSK